MTAVTGATSTLGCAPTITPADIDIAALQRKYRSERDKRLRSDGSTQYIELGDGFAQFAERDPHTPFVDRDAVSVHTDVAILGGGFAGLLSAVALKKAGVEDISIIEMSGDFGLGWRTGRCRRGRSAFRCVSQARIGTETPSDKTGFPSGQLDDIAVSSSKTAAYRYSHRSTSPMKFA